MKCATTTRECWFRQGAIALMLLLLGAGAIGCGKATFAVPSSSMAPTIPAGSKVVADLQAFKKGDPVRWDVVTFHSPPIGGQRSLWVLRVVGLPGEVVSFSESGELLINGKVPELPAEIGLVRFREPSATHVAAFPHPFTIPAGSYYLLGDNVVDANDSRYWGAVARTNITGKVLQVMAP
jgi:signal peptidase I